MLKKRELDGVYFRVFRDGKWDSVCFTDLTEDQQRAIMENKSSEWLANMCVILARVIRELGDDLDIVREYD